MKPHVLSKVTIVFAADLPVITDHAFHKLAEQFSKLGFVQPFRFTVPVHEFNNGSATVSEHVVIGYLTANHTSSIKLGNRTFELATTEYIDKYWFMDLVTQSLKLFAEHGLVNSISIEVCHATNINALIPTHEYSLSDMIDGNRPLPLEMVHNEYSDCHTKQASQMTMQTIENDTIKIETLLTHHDINFHKTIANQGYPPIIPEQELEPYGQLGLNINFNNMYDTTRTVDENGYLVLCSKASALGVPPINNDSIEDIIERLNSLGGYSRKEFDIMRSIDVTNEIWEF